MGYQQNEVFMQIISREQTDARSTCIIQLEDGERYNENALLNVCSHISIPRCSSSIGNIPEHKGRYEVSVKTGFEAYDDLFAEMVNQYVRA